MLLNMEKMIYLLYGGEIRMVQIKDGLNELKGKTVIIRVAFYEAIAGATIHGKYEGVLECTAVLGHENFIVLENDIMINIKYVQTIEIKK